MLQVSTIISRDQSVLIFNLTASKRAERNHLIDMILSSALDQITSDTKTHKTQKVHNTRLNSDLEHTAFTSYNTK